MKYTSEIEINKPRETVIKLFDDPENMKEWMPGLLSFEPVSGTPGQPGAKSKLMFDMNGRKVEMLETITVRNLPDEFSGTYEALGVWNFISNTFIAISPDKTKWVTINEFKFTNLMMKVIGFLMPGTFKKTSMKYLELFKAFAERS